MDRVLTQHKKIINLIKKNTDAAKTYLSMKNRIY